MERLEERIDLAKKALSKLEEALQLPKDTITRDAAIQRFEFTWEATWKLLQLYLRQQEGVELASPKNIFRHCQQNGFLDETQTELALKMTDDRHLTVHTYNEELAQIIFSHLPKYTNLLGHLISKVENNYGNRNFNSN